MADSKQSPESLALRAPPRPVTRLNRRTLAVGLGALASAILGGTIWSLQPHSKTPRDPGAELHNVDRVAHAEGLDQLPTDYSKLPKKAADTPPVLGNPLPGDLGVPMLRAEQQLPQPAAASPTPAMARPDPAAEAARMERANREREAEDAAKGPLFFKTARRSDAGSASAPAVARADANGEAHPGTASSATANRAPLDEQRAFLVRGADEGTRSSHALQSPASPYQVMAGTIISA